MCACVRSFIYSVVSDLCDLPEDPDKCFNGPSQHGFVLPSTASVCPESACVCVCVCVRDKKILMGEGLVEKNSSVCLCVALKMQRFVVMTESDDIL